MGDECCKNKKALNGTTNGDVQNGNAQNGDSHKSNGADSKEILFDPVSFPAYDPSQEVIFPPELKVNTLGKLTRLN